MFGFWFRGMHKQKTCETVKSEEIICENERFGKVSTQHKSCENFVMSQVRREDLESSFQD